MGEGGGEDELHLDIVGRAEWGAVPRAGGRRAEELRLPVGELVEDYDTGVEPCWTRDECVERVRQLQRRDLELGEPDITYNFLIGGDGRIYEGRGWRGQLFSDYPWNGIAIGHIGHFNEEELPKLQMVYAMSNLVHYGKEKHYVTRRCHHLNVNKLKPPGDDADADAATAADQLMGARFSVPAGQRVAGAARVREFYEYSVRANLQNNSEYEDAESSDAEGQPPTWADRYFRLIADARRRFRSTHGFTSKTFRNVRKTRRRKYLVKKGSAGRRFDFDR